MLVFLEAETHVADILKLLPRLLCIAGLTPDGAICIVKVAAGLIWDEEP